MASQAQAFEWVDDEISYTYQPWTADPTVKNGVPTHTVTVTHVDGYAYGTNFINISGTAWGAKDRSTTGGSFSGQEQGGQSVFAVGRFALSGNKIFNTTAFSYGPLTDISLDIGGNAGVHNNTFASETRAFVIGPQFSFDLPEKGFANLAFHMYKEWNHDGFGPTNAPGSGNGVAFDPTYNVELGWSQPIPVGIPGFAFKGFLSYTGPKGIDGEGNRTVAETYLHMKLVVDAGDMIFNVPKKLEAGIGYEFWYNVFGNDHRLSNAAGGTNLTNGDVESTPFITVTYKF